MAIRTEPYVLSNRQQATVMSSGIFNHKELKRSALVYFVSEDGWDRFTVSEVEGTCDCAVPLNI